jgi:hypothetical protein
LDARVWVISHDTWLPELRQSFLKLARAIRKEESNEMRFVTHRIRGCAAMGGAYEIVGTMDDLDVLAQEGQWQRVRWRFTEANRSRRSITHWFTQEYATSRVNPRRD